MPASAPSSDRYDVVILGGAFSGGAAALLLRREQPQLRVLVVEKAEAFDSKVGEATTEMSAMFLTRRLALWQHLENEQLPKEGLRYWFSNEQVHGHADASEAGGFLRSAVPSFQLRRDAIDEHILATAVGEGAELSRPTRARDVVLGDFDHRVTLDQASGTRTVFCRWLLDATGRTRLLSKQLGITSMEERHPIAAVWGRWKGVRHIDDLAARSPSGLAARNLSSRRLATNHYMGFGYWIWFIPLGNGETSVGIVFDKRIHSLHESRDREGDYLAFLKAIPACAELIEGATLRRDDLRSYAHLPYKSLQYMGRGWALLGDAASFLDPYYSPGLDHASFTVEATTEIIKRDVAGEDITAAVEEHNVTFVRSYERFFQAAFEDKYFYMGECDLLAASFLLDTAHYYVFVVIPAYRFLRRFYWMPVFGPRPAFFSYHLMRFYNRRFRNLALLRRAVGEAGLRNHGRRIKAYFNLNLSPFQMGLRGARLWMVAEADGLRLALKRVLRGAPLVEPAPGRKAMADLALSPQDPANFGSASHPAPPEHPDAA